MKQIAASFSHVHETLRKPRRSWSLLADVSEMSVQVAFGNGHQLSEVNCFLPFSSHLPFELAAAVTEAASAITTSTCE